MQLEFVSRDGSVRSSECSPIHGVIAGWTGRDQQAVQAHIDELAEIGIAPPSATPLFYRVAAQQFTTSPNIEVIGANTSGEVEACILAHMGKLWVGVASDHTDRILEAHSVAHSKQVCAKPIAPVFWEYDAVSAHWDNLLVRSFRVTDEGPVLYQEGRLGSNRPADELLATYLEQDRLGQAPEGLIMLCGTQPVIGEIRGSSGFRIELVDEVRGRSITHQYIVSELACVS